VCENPASGKIGLAYNRACLRQEGGRGGENRHKESAILFTASATKTADPLSLLSADLS
jgi:hypothetical protein